MNLNQDNEHEVLCEKIISDIQNVFNKDAALSSFEIIPTIEDRNKSPVVHVEHNLGLESWCAKHVYDYTHKMLISMRRQNAQQQQRYLQQSDVLVKYLNVALLINPDVTTFWNMRRQFVQKNRLPINKEIRFAALVLSKKPKSNEAFAYRRWLFSFQSSESMDWPLEIGICDRCADRCSSNYHAWSHRQWVLQNAPFLIRSELMLSEKFMRKHISDYSSYHYRQVVIARTFEIYFYEPHEMRYLDSLAQLINYYLIGNVSTMNEILDVLLPNIDHSLVGEQCIRSLLYCCNLAAYDMQLCDAQKNMYGERESFDMHRRACLKFIVEQCVRILQAEQAGFFKQMLVLGQATPAAKLHKFDYGTHKFFTAVQHSEGLLGRRHREWCALFLGFDYTTAA